MSDLTNFNSESNFKSKSLGKNFAFLLLITALLGTHLIAVSFGSFRVSPYRAVLIISPFLLLHSKRALFNNLRLGVAYGYFKFLFIWIVYSVISLVWVADFDSWVRIFIFLLSGIITTWLLGLFLTSREDFYKALKIVEKLALFFAVFAVYEIVTGNYLFLNEESLDFYGTESSLYSSIGVRIPMSIFGNPNHYAVFLLFAIIFSFILSKCKKTKYGKLSSTFAYILFSFLLLCTQSRASFFALIIILLISLFLIAKRANFMRFVAFILGFILVSIPIILYNFDYIAPLFVVGSDEVQSDFLRQNLLKNGLMFLEDTYYFGVGIGNIEYYMEFFGLYFVGDITNMHNWWMEILVSSGILIFIVYMYHYFNCLRILLKISKSTKNVDDLYISSCFFALLVGFFIGAVGPSSLFISEWFFPLFGLVIVYINLFKKKIYNVRSYSF